MNSPETPKRGSHEKCQMVLCIKISLICLTIYDLIGSECKVYAKLNVETVDM